MQKAVRNVGSSSVAVAGAPQANSYRSTNHILSIAVDVMTNKFFGITAFIRQNISLGGDQLSKGNGHP
jgi:hypothetical protein